MYFIIDLSRKKVCVTSSYELAMLDEHTASKSLSKFNNWQKYVSPPRPPQPINQYNTRI